MGNKKICAVTGKDIWDIGNGTSETYYKNVDIKLTLAQRILELIQGGVTDFLCNAEHGFPLWAAEIILSHRNLEGLPPFRLHLVMPHENQAEEWDDDVHERLYSVHEQSDAALILYRQYRDDCYENSERFMIDHCDVLLTDDTRTFAAQYAELHGKPILVCEKLERI